MVLCNNQTSISVVLKSLSSLTFIRPSSCEQFLLAEWEVKKEALNPLDEHGSTHLRPFSAAVSARLFRRGRFGAAVSAPRLFGAKTFRRRDHSAPRLFGAETIRRWPFRRGRSGARTFRRRDYSARRLFGADIIRRRFFSAQVISMLV